MKKYGVLFLTIFVMIASANLFAQTDTLNQNQMQTQDQEQMQNQTQAQEISPMDTMNKIGGVVVDTSSADDPEQVAKDMAVELMQRINLTMEQTTEITEILEEYISDVREIHQNKNLGTENVDSEKELEYREEVADEEGNLTDNREAIETDVDALRGNLGTNEDLSDLDREANSEIEDVLEEDQIDAYMFIKKDWWNNVKQRVYGTTGETEDFNSTTETGTDIDAQNEGNIDDQNPQQQNFDENTNEELNKTETDLDESDRLEGNGDWDMKPENQNNQNNTEEYSDQNSDDPNNQDDTNNQ